MAELKTQVLLISIVTPILYVGVLLSAFFAFSVLYRRHRLNKLISLEPIFGPNYLVEMYLHLKEKYVLKAEGAPPEKVVKAALLRRAVEAIRRSLKLKENEPVFNRLYQEGLIGDDLFKQFQFQDKVQKVELKEIVEECVSFHKDWPQTFFPVAQEICYNEALRRRLLSMDDRLEALQLQWDYYVQKAEPMGK